jgi:hypothetical protein
MSEGGKLSRWIGMIKELKQQDHDTMVTLADTSGRFLIFSH